VIELLENPEAVLSLKNDEVVLVGGVPVIFNVDNIIKGWGFFTTQASREVEYVAECAEIAKREQDPFIASIVQEAIYSDYIHNVRLTGKGVGLYKIEDFVAAFKQGPDAFSIY
jgi:hypothetical protein